MSDLIKREDAIDALAEAMPSLTTPDGSGEFDRDIQIADEAFVDAMQIINDLPSADKPQEWIPCRERMPSEQGQYLVTFPLCNGEPWVYILSFNKGKFYETDDEWGDVEYDDVTAWMPLPEPWKGADDDIH